MFPVQGPLARQPVLLSGRVVAYYGLICASRSLLPLYGLCSRPAPCDLLWAGSERVPNLLCVSVLRAVFRTPMDCAVAFGCFFTALTGLRRIRTGSASIIPTLDGSGVGVSRGCKVSFMVRPDELACPSPSRTFTFELSPPESPHRDVEYHYAGKQPIPRDRTCTS